MAQFCDNKRAQVFDLSGPADVCADCAVRYQCRQRSARTKAALFAWARDADPPECVDYRPQWFRGLEGVRP